MLTHCHPSCVGSRTMAQILVKNAVKNVIRRKCHNEKFSCFLVSRLMALNCKRLATLREKIYQLAKENVLVFSRFTTFFKHLFAALEICFTNSKHCRLLTNPKRYSTIDPALSACVKRVVAVCQKKTVNVITDFLNETVLRQTQPMTELSERLTLYIKMGCSRQLLCDLVPLMQEVIKTNNVRDCLVETFEPLYRQTIDLYSLVHKALTRVAHGTQVGQHCLPLSSQRDMFACLQNARHEFAPMKDAIVEFHRLVEAMVPSAVSEIHAHQRQLEEVLDNKYCFVPLLKK